MNLNDLTIGDLKQLAALGLGRGPCDPAPCAHPLIGCYVIVRADRAGVFAGVLQSREDDRCVLTECRRLWQWKAPQGVALSGVAMFGLVSSGSKVDAPTACHEVAGVIEVIGASDLARESIRGC